MKRIISALGRTSTIFALCGAAAIAVDAQTLTSADLRGDGRLGLAQRSMCPIMAIKAVDAVLTGNGCIVPLASA